MDEYYQLIRQLPVCLSRPLAALPSWLAAAVQEIRLRSTGDIFFTVNGSSIKACQYCTALQELNSVAITDELLWNLLIELCGHSLHTHEDQLQQGYFTLPGGHRVGIGGRFANSDAGYSLQSVSSLNFRIARSHKVRLSSQLSELLLQPFGGLILIGPPLCGKTTILRSIAVLLGQNGRICTVIDERDELFAAHPTTTRQCPVDIISGIDKAAAAQIALRTLSPQVILLDELGEMREVQVLGQAISGGVNFVATLHAQSFAQAERKPQFLALRQAGLIQAACLFAGRTAPGVITEMRYY